MPRNRLHLCVREFCHTRRRRKVCRKEVEPTLHAANGIRERFPILKDALLELNLGRSHMLIWVLVAEITNEAILGLDIRGLGATHAATRRGRRTTCRAPGRCPARPVVWWRATM